MTPSDTGNAMALSLPWKVVYQRSFPEWDEKSSPVIVDANGRKILLPLQFVGHPGIYDERADRICQTVVECVNQGESSVYG